MLTFDRFPDENLHVDVQVAVHEICGSVHLEHHVPAPPPAVGARTALVRYLRHGPIEECPELVDGNFFLLALRTVLKVVPPADRFELGFFCTVPGPEWVRKR